MKEFEETQAEDYRLWAAALAYLAVMLVAFTIGLYGLFSLFWLATNTVERSLHAVGFLL